MDVFADAATSIAFELSLFAAVVFLVFGVDDVIVDLTWLWLQRRSAVDRTQPISCELKVGEPSRFAIAIPAWRESSVIGLMLATLRDRWPQADIRILVGVYPNDVATMSVVMKAACDDPRVRMAVNTQPGPTTKGDCLNHIWRALMDESASDGFKADALLIHDAEDVVDALELEVLGAALSTYDYAQIPVIPLMAPRARWVGRHYCDEFAESHGKELPVRSAIGAPLPTAGVGCAFRVEALKMLDTGGGPFSADCLTEDYELGVRLGRIGKRGTFVRRFDHAGQLIASRALFPMRIDDSVRQKTRWLRGIALDGWDRLGWTIGRSKLGSWMLGVWMLWRDRRVVLAAMAVASGYAALFIGLIAWASGASAPEIHEWVLWLMLINSGLLVWRLAMRGWQTARLYGPAEGGMAILRQPVSNIILVMTAWRALWSYMRRRHRPLVWDKTEHLFPST